jgi:hypothetical protein
MPRPGFPYHNEQGVQDSTSHKAFPVLEQDQPTTVMTSASLGTGAILFPPGSLLGLSLLEGAPNVINFFIMVQSLSLCLIGYG